MKELQSFQFRRKEAFSMSNVIHNQGQRYDILSQLGWNLSIQQAVSSQFGKENVKKAINKNIVTLRDVLHK